MIIDIEALQEELEALLHSKNAKYFVDSHEGAKVYKLHTRESQLVMTVGEKWIGYELSVDLGDSSKLGSTEDTDNYPLNGQNSENLLKIFAELKECLKALLSEGIFVGVQNDMEILALPDSPNTYKVTYYKKAKKLWHNFVSSEIVHMSSSQLDSINNLRPVE